jgi:hypothetical protein
MTDHPERPWFRFHLLTLLLMTVAAGGLVGANLMRYQSYNSDIKVPKDMWEQFNAQERAQFFNVGYGWPLCCYEIVPAQHRLFFSDTEEESFRSVYYWSFAINIVTALLILASTAFLSEFLLRRREGRKL